MSALFSRFQPSTIIYVILLEFYASCLRQIRGESFYGQFIMVCCPSSGACFGIFPRSSDEGEDITNDQLRLDFYIFQIHAFLFRSDSWWLVCEWLYETWMFYILFSDSPVFYAFLQICNYFYYTLVYSNSEKIIKLYSYNSNKKNNKTILL